MMLKEILLTAMWGLLIAIPLALAVYGLIRLLLRRFGRTAQVVCVLALVVLGVGILYGFLRFSGLILFPNDHTISSHWFDASWRDDGFRYWYSCGTFAAAILAALRTKKKNPTMKE